MSRTPDRSRAWEGPPVLSRSLALAILAGLTLIAGACSRSNVPLPLLERTEVPPPTAIPPNPERPTEVRETFPTPGGEEATFAVIGIPTGGELPIYQTAGVTASDAGSLASDKRGIELTGRQTALGTSVWVEILLPQGGVGWVNAWNLTENVSPGAFCSDSRVLDLLDGFEQALRAKDGDQLVRLASPRRGLIIHRNWWNQPVRFAPELLPTVFDDPEPYDWGLQVGSEEHVIAPFRTAVTPLLDRLFDAESPIRSCNELVVGESDRASFWPSEYDNLNYYSLHRPPPSSGNPFDWRTWAVAIEYVDGRPFLAVLLHYWAGF